MVFTDFLAEGYRGQLSGVFLRNFNGLTWREPSVFEDKVDLESVSSFGVLGDQDYVVLNIDMDTMKVFGFWVLFMGAGTALTFLTFSSTISSVSDEVFPSHGDSVAATASNRKLKQEESSKEITGKKWNGDNMTTEDYRLTDSVPSSRASIKSAPIEHGSPLMPNIPKPTPPSHPQQDASP